MVVSARINSSKPVRLVVDTGAKRILLSRSAASKAGLIRSRAVGVFGIGPQATRSAYRANAATISLDGLDLRDVEVDVADHDFPPGVDGLLGTAMFRGYVVRFDSPRRRLDLLPTSGAAETDSVHSIRHGHFLLVSTVASGLGHGWFLLDTGSGFSAVEEDMADVDGSLRMPVAGISGRTSARALGPMEFHVAGQRLWDRNAFALDLSEFNRRSGLQIAGMIGFSALRHTVVTIDYRSGRIWIESR
jgi:predicted aspartyl protease